MSITLGKYAALTRKNLLERSGMTYVKEFTQKDRSEKTGWLLRRRRMTGKCGCVETCVSVGGDGDTAVENGMDIEVVVRPYIDSIVV